MVLDDLCYDLGFDGKAISSDNPRFAQLVNLFSNLEISLSQSLSAEQQKLLMQLTDAHDEMIAVVSLDCFVEGFRLGNSIVGDSNLSNQ